MFKDDGTVLHFTNPKVQASRKFAGAFGVPSLELEVIGCSALGPFRAFSLGL